ncbi:zinc-binding dehydrogenase [Natronosporangium hydrolyticum]|uniref:Zinc-binding dehydrogenase n=1 Tax=Natronosporangium hydrolyticum TaxID=2811111 RepID=A0A895YH36_9ACTN|nr:zinc-binding dehydrogenase [Natronosporangium hydrolyticum]QSB15402.1 zinc-binding dehydrogenase [Natronosporangium hydrolyticum]
MRAQLLTGFGGPEMLHYREDVPDPTSGPGEVRIRVAATALNNTDIWTREGRYGSPDDPAATTGWRREPLHFPRIQGADVVGYLDQLGPGVTTETAGALGSRVLVDPMLYQGDETALAHTDYLGSERDGGFADYLTVPAGNVHPIDSPLTDPELASFPTAYATALRMLNRAEVTDGETVLITGASGGVGSALIQLAAVRGARPVALVGPGKAEAATELGAALAVERDTMDIAGALAAVGPIDVVADVVGGAGFGALLNVVRPFGRYVTAGGIAGPVVETDLRTVYLKQLTLVGSSFATHEEFAELVELIRAAGRHARTGQLRPLVAEVYPLPELARAQADFAAKRFFGKLVIAVG